MTIDHRAGAISVERLGPPDLVEVFGFLDHDPVLNVYLLALTLRDGLASPRDECWGARRDGELVGVLHVGAASGAMLPLAMDPGAEAAIAEQALARIERLPRRFQLHGPRSVIGAVVRRLAEEGIAPRLLRDQIYMSLDRGGLAPFDRLPSLRRAGREDAALVYESGADLRAEELEEDPRIVDPAGYAKRVDEECRDGYTYLWIDGGGLCFRASVSAQTPDAAQVAGVFTPRPRRNGGLARRGLSELCARLLEKSRAACLFVNDFNAPAIAVYRRMGFRDLADWASAFYVVPNALQ